MIDVLFKFDEGKRKLGGVSFGPLRTINFSGIFVSIEPGNEGVHLNVYLENQVFSAYQTMFTFLSSYIISLLNTTLPSISYLFQVSIFHLLLSI